MNQHIFIGFDYHYSYTIGFPDAHVGTHMLEFGDIDDNQMELQVKTHKQKVAKP
jgi:hypothetical protein